MRKRRILDVLMKQYTDNACNYAEPAVRNVKIWEVKVDEISCKSFGLRPSEVKYLNKVPTSEFDYR